MKRFLLLGQVMALLLSAAAHADDAPVVARVLVEGNSRVDADAVRAVISTKPGQAIDTRQIDEDVKAVMKLGFFSDVIVEERGSEERPDVVFRVAEKPSVSEAKILGLTELSADDLKDAVEVKEGTTLDLSKVKKSARNIQDKYVEKGFFLAEVTPRVEERSDNRVAVIFDVNERAKVQVKEIRFVGNRHVSRDELLGVMSTQEGGYLSFLSSSGNYREEVFQHDLQNVQFVYGDRGYIYAKIAKPSVSLSADRRFLYITIRIDEGDQYRVGKIDFAGELLHDKEELERLTRVRKGDLFSRSAVGKDLVALADVYRDVGYAYANVNPETKVDPNTRIVDLTYEIQPGRKNYFERVEIVGNIKTRDKVIRRELRIFEGELFSASAVNASKARVTALGFFESVNISTDRGSAEDKLVARVTVKERSTGSFQLGAGFSSYENFILTGQISQNNFLGWGQTLSLSISYSSVRQLGQIQYVNPSFLDTKWTFATDLYATEGSYTNFQRKAVGGSMTWGYELNGLAPHWRWAEKLEDLRLFGTYTNEFVRVTSTSAETITLYNRFRSGTTSSLRFSLQWDKRDNRLFPTRGIYQSVSAEIAPPFLAPEGMFGSKVNLFTRYSYEARFYHPLPLGFTGRAKIAMGYMAGWDSDHPVPISELYYLGGINSLRGYRMLSVAPTVPVLSCSKPDCSLSEMAIGGNKQLVMNFEAEFPIADKAGVRGVVFFDMGNAFAQGAWSDSDVSLSLYKSVGFGLRWFSPMGPLRFEWGFPLDRRIDRYTHTYRDSVVDFQFTIGSFF